MKSYHTPQPPAAPAQIEGADALAASRRDSLDRLHGVAGVYRHLDRPDEHERRTHKNAFIVYQWATLAGDVELADSAKKRFFEASKQLAGKQRRVRP
jgi:hypothetical protein